MSKKIATGKILRVTLIKSPIGYTKNQKSTVRALGLHRINQTVEQKDSPAVRGMLNKVSHLIKIEE
ncbi:MAG: 50S ribosomal protein L30 [Anaerolineae bacterium]|nr:50S ribosomal protein L30 [Anaerolineae bacterium]